jgi:hypothetical protein
VIRATGDSIVERRADDVFAYLTDVSTHVDWQTNELFVDPLTPPPVGIGFQFLEVRQTLGRRFQSVVEVVEYEPLRRFGYQVVEGPVPYRVDFRLSEPDGERTRVEMALSGETGAFFDVAESLLQSVAAREVAGALGNMKDILEGGTSRHKEGAGAGRRPL